jgi:broad specificity phosphatase PhoE
MRLYLIRHADPDYDRQTITPAGRLEAQALACRMAAEGLTRLYTSPLGRARHTAQPIADLTKLDAVTLPWTEELVRWRLPEGQYDAAMVWDTPGECIRAGDTPADHTAWRDRAPFSEVEPLQSELLDLYRQGDEFLAEWGYVRDGQRYRIERPNRERLALVCHNGLGLTWLAHLLNLPLPLVYCGFWLAPSSVTTILFEERSADWAVPRCLNVGDVSHLYAARLPVQPRGINANYA